MSKIFPVIVIAFMAALSMGLQIMSVFPNSNGVKLVVISALAAFGICMLVVEDHIYALEKKAGVRK